MNILRWKQFQFLAFVSFAILIGFTSTVVNAGTVNIDFETDENGNNLVVPGLYYKATALTDAYSSLGVNWGGNGVIIDQSGNVGVTGISPRNFLFYSTLASWNVPSIDTMTFTTLQRSVEFNVGQGDTIDNVIADTFTATAFNAANVIVDTFQTTLTSHVQTVSLSASEISYVTYLLDDLTGSFAVDNLSFSDISSDVSAVPLPPSAFLFGTALLGLAGLRRRKRKAA